jgi:hypothetical protein
LDGGEIHRTFYALSRQVGCVVHTIGMGRACMIYGIALP